MGYQDFFDREGDPRSFSYYNTGVNPHVLTVRFTYTVPAGKAAFVMSRAASIARTDPASSPFAAAAYHRSNLSAGGLKEVLLVPMRSNTIGDTVVIAQGRCGPIAAGDVLEGVTVDGSVAGAIGYSLGLEVMEFDRKIT